MKDRIASMSTLKLIDVQLTNAQRTVVRTTIPRMRQGDDGKSPSHYVPLERPPELVQMPGYEETHKKSFEERSEGPSTNVTEWWIHLPLLRSRR